MTKISNVLFCHENGKTLNKRFTCHPENAALKHQCAKLLLTAAKLSTVCLSFAGLVCGTVYLSTLPIAAPYLPYLIVASACGTGTADAVIITWLDKIILLQSVACEQIRRVAKIYNELTSFEDYELKSAFRDHDIYRYDIEDLSAVKGGMKTLSLGLAHLIDLKKCIEYRQKGIEKLKETDPIFEVTKTAISLDEQLAAIMKMQAAYERHLLLHPFSGQKLSDIGSFTPLDKIPSPQKEVFVFKDPSKSPITLEDLNDSSLQSLTSRL